MFQHVSAIDLSGHHQSFGVRTSTNCPSCLQPFWNLQPERCVSTTVTMQPWLVSVVVVAIVTMTSLFLGSFDSLELGTQGCWGWKLPGRVLFKLGRCCRYQEFGLNCNYLSESVEKEWWDLVRCVALVLSIDALSKGTLQCWPPLGQVLGQVRGSA